MCGSAWLSACPLPRRGCSSAPPTGSAASAARTGSPPCPYTTWIAAGSSSRAVSITCLSSGRPASGCNTLGSRDFMRLPSPAARITTDSGAGERVSPPPAARAARAATTAATAVRRAPAGGGRRRALDTTFRMVVNCTGRCPAGRPKGSSASAPHGELSPLVRRRLKAQLAQLVAHARADVELGVGVLLVRGLLAARDQLRRGVERLLERSRAG